jgi:hypothetical protein
MGLRPTKGDENGRVRYHFACEEGERSLPLWRSRGREGV